MSRRRYTLALRGFLIGLMLGFTACAPLSTPPPPTATPAPPAITLRVTGSGSVTAVLRAVARAFEDATAGYILNVLPGSSSGGGITGVLNGTLEVAAVSRGATAEEIAQGIEVIQFGTSATAIFTHPDVGVTALTRDQLVGILTGSITNWSEVGGADQMIALYVREADEGNTGDLRDTYLGDAEFAASAVLLTSQSAMQEAVSGVTGALGYGTWASALANGADVVSVTIDGVGVTNPPDTLTTYMGIGYLRDQASTVQPLIDWLLSPAGQAALQAIGVVPVANEST